MMHVMACSQQSKYQPLEAMLRSRQRKWKFSVDTVAATSVALSMIQSVYLMPQQAVKGIVTAYHCARKT